MDIMVRLAPPLNKLVFLLFCWLTISCETKVKPVFKYINTDKHQLTSVAATTYLKGEPVNGIVYALYPNKDTMYSVTYLNGRENGISRAYYPGNRLKELRYFKNGWKEGTHKGWYLNGRRAFVYEFKSDVFHGKFREWTSTGVLFRDMTYEEGQESGSQTVRYADGKIKSNYVIRNGVRYGLLGTKNCSNVSDSIFVNP